MIRKIWRWFWSPTARFAWGTVIIAGFFAGILFWGGFHTAMEATNSIEFCTSCHEMRDTVYPEYIEPPHYKNAAGVRATCPDCHVPHSWGPMVVRKIQASGELWSKFVTGSISTPEKFEAERWRMANSVWASMRATDSRECRNCHSYEAMDFDHQEPRAADEMRKAMDEGATCIECHQGVAHKKPRDPNDDDDEIGD